MGRKKKCVCVCVCGQAWWSHCYPLVLHGTIYVVCMWGKEGGDYLCVCVSVCVHMLFSLPSCCGCSHIRSVPASITKGFSSVFFPHSQLTVEYVLDFYQCFCSSENLQDLKLRTMQTSILLPLDTKHNIWFNIAFTFIWCKVLYFMYACHIRLLDL